MDEKTAPAYNPRRLHVKAFAEQHAQLQGDTPLAEFPRLLEECQETNSSTPVHWQAQGGTRQPQGSSIEIWLDISAQVTLQMTCQRCLQGMDETVSTSRRFRFVHDEATAAQLDEEIEEDVLVYSKQFDLLALIEDELLMALPLAPRHAVCPAPLEAPPQSTETTQKEALPHPFAVLGQLRKPR